MKRFISVSSNMTMKMLFGFVFTAIMVAGFAWPAPVWARPMDEVRTVTFRLDAKFGSRQVYPFKFAQAGCVMARITNWQATNTASPSQALSLILNGDYRSSFYARADNKNSRIEPIQLAYEVTAGDVGQVKDWNISVVNFSKSGSATGLLVINLMPGRRPCPSRQPAT